jgi:Ase1/PRC1/MAP65 family protein
MDTLSAADQENRRKPQRAGSVPARATTPVNSVTSHIPGSVGYSSGKGGAVIPAIRPPSSMGSNSMPNKRQKFSDNLSTSQTRAPLAAHRGQAVNAPHPRNVSPGKTGIPGKTPMIGSSLPRPVAMPMPKGTAQHQQLGHGRFPSSTSQSHGYHQSSQHIKAGSVVPSIAMNGRLVSSTSGTIRQTAMKKASRARRESFKPRPSIDGEGGIRGSRWGGLAASVTEEDEVY